jgi:hypothetical protein
MSSDNVVIENKVNILVVDNRDDELLLSRPVVHDLELPFPEGARRLFTKNDSLRKEVLSLVKTKQERISKILEIANGLIVSDMTELHAQIKTLIKDFV